MQQKKDKSQASGQQRQNRIIQEKKALQTSDKKVSRTSDKKVPKIQSEKFPELRIKRIFRPVKTT